MAKRKQKLTELTYAGKASLNALFSDINRIQCNSIGASFMHTKGAMDGEKEEKIIMNFSY